MSADRRARQVGHNEALFRSVNDKIESLDRDLASALDTSPQEFVAVCECGELECTQQVRVASAVYGRARANPEWFILVPGHEAPDVEKVVETGEGYVIVEKRAPEAKEFARSTDPT